MRTRAIVAVTVFVLVLSSANPAPSAPASGPPAPSCVEQRVSVATLPGGPSNHSMVGTLCGAGGARGRTVQLLVHGWMQNHLYWDFPYQPEHYSYVRAATAAGYATFNFDRLGAGASSYPPAAEVHVPSAAFVLHQIVQALRSGAIGGVAFERVVLVSHALGAIIAETEAGTYHDVDAVVATSFVHTDDAILIAYFTARETEPAQNDPRLRDRPAGYITTAPGAVSRHFHYAPNSDPYVLAIMEANRDTASVLELPSVASYPVTTASVDVPVLLVVGQEDRFVCGPGLPCDSDATVAAREQPFMPHAQLEAHVMPRTGHNLPQHLNAQDFFRLVIDFTDRVSGR
jgi:hypothetical protein